MKFEEVLPKLREGRKIRCGEWPSHTYVRLVDGELVDHDGDPPDAVNLRGFLGDDWEVLPDKKILVLRKMTACNDTYHDGARYVTVYTAEALEQLLYARRDEFSHAVVHAANMRMLQACWATGIPTQDNCENNDVIDEEWRTTYEELKVGSGLVRLGEDQVEVANYKYKSNPTPITLHDVSSSDLFALGNRALRLATKKRRKENNE